MHNPSASLLITVPVYGQHEYTHALVHDLEREGADYLIVDNGGDYPALGNERVVTPGRNLGWAGGSDLGFRIAFSEGYSHAMTLNNDTRISKGFVDALLDRRLPPDAGIVAPAIDHGFPSAESDEKPAAADYQPVQRYRSVSVIEGTALALSRECWQTIGGLGLADVPATRLGCRPGSRVAGSRCGIRLVHHRNGLHQPLWTRDRGRHLR